MIVADSSGGPLVLHEDKGLISTLSKRGVVSCVPELYVTLFGVEGSKVEVHTTKEDLSGTLLLSYKELGMEDNVDCGVREISWLDKEKEN